LDRSGLKDLRIHDIRRTFGSYQAISGASLHIIGKSLGHKSSQATQVYARLNLDPVRASVEKATATMFSVMNGKHAT
jgi:integrase